MGSITRVASTGVFSKIFGVSMHRNIPCQYLTAVDVQRILQPENLPESYEVKSSVFSSEVISVTRDEVIEAARADGIITDADRIRTNRLGTRDGFRLALPLKDKQQKEIYDFFFHSPPDIDLSKAEQKIDEMHDLDISLGTFDWKYITSFGGAVFKAIKSVDGPLIRRSFPTTPFGIPLLFENPATLIKVAAFLGFSYLFMINGVDVPYLGVVQAPTSFAMATLYLAFNAVRNIISDKMAMNGTNPRNWFTDTYIDWNKMTTSIFSTALAYPFLSLLKETLNGASLHNSNLLILTPFIMMITDGIYQFVARKIRGFDSKTAIKDFLRPFAGDMFTLGLSLAFPPVMTVSFLYLLTRKSAAETWSGFIEFVQKRREEANAREYAMTKILNFDRYHVPDKEAMAAINFVHVINTLPNSEKLYRRFFEFAGDNITNRFDKIRLINTALKDQNRIEETIQFLFPFQDQEIYRETMMEQFKSNLENYDRITEEYLSDLLLKIELSKAESEEME